MKLPKTPQQRFLLAALEKSYTQGIVLSRPNLQASALVRMGYARWQDGVAPDGSMLLLITLDGYLAAARLSPIRPQRKPICVTPL